MSKTLRPPAGSSRVLAPMTTAQLARRMLAASAAVAKSLPVGFYSAPALDILLSIHAAEEEARYPDALSLEVPGLASPDVMDRWVALLVDSDLLEQRAGLLALTSLGHQTVIDLLERVYGVQRSLD